MHVKVGKDAKDFGLHKGLLCNSSQYFRAAFEGSFKEAEEQVLLLPEDDVEVFQLFQFWLYYRKLLDTGESVADLSRSLLIGLYLFAETRCISQLQDLTIDALIRKIDVGKKIPTGAIPRIYENTTETSPLRRFIVDISARIGDLRDGIWFNRETEIRYSETFLIDLVRALYDEKLKRSPQDFSKFRCNYHVHTKAEGCYLSQEQR